MGFYDELNKDSGKPSGGFYANLKKPKTLKSTGQMMLDAAKTAALPVTWTLGQLGDRIDATQAAAMDPLTRKFSTGESKPLGESLSDLASAPITGNPPEGYTRGDAAYEAGVRGGLEPWQARTLSILGSLPVAEGLNSVGKGIVAPAARAVANAEVGGLSTRTIPGVKQTLELFGPAGVTLPNRYREGFYSALKQAEGTSDYRGYLRDKALRDGLKLSDDAQDAIATAIETRTIPSLPDALRPVAEAVRKEGRNMIADRLRAGLARNELSSPNLDYAARIMTKEERVARGLKPYGVAQDFPPPALSTTTGKGRTGMGRVLTSEQMSSGAKAQGRRLFEPVVKGTLQKGASNDAAVMHANIVRALDRQFGRTAASGEATIGSIRGIPTGFDDATKARLATRALPKEIHSELERMNKTFQHDEWGKATNVIRTINNEFRKWALFSPGFISRNSQNNLVQNVIAGNHNPATWTDAFALRLRMAKNVTTRSDAPKIEEMIRLGVIGKGQTALETGKGARGAYNAPFNWMRNLNTASEDVSRMALYNHFRSTGQSAEKAAASVNTWLFNYSPTFKSQGFQKLRRTAFPFINWKSQVPGLFVKSVTERPGSFGMAGNIRNQLDAQAPPDASEGLPKWAREAGAVYNPRSRNFFIPQMLGQSDLDEVVKDLRRGPEGWTRLGITNAYPQYGIGAAEAFPKQGNRFLERPYEYKPGEERMAQAPAVFKTLLLNENGKQFLKEHGFTVKDDGTVLAPVRVATWLGGMPQLRLANIAADILEPDPNSEFRLKSFLLGIREVPANQDWQANGK